MSELENRVEEVLAGLTLEEKVLLAYGRDGVYIGGIDRVNIPKVGMSDGPQGIRLEDGRTSTALPSGIALAASWDPAIAEEYGALIAREVFATGFYVSLGPMINLMRTPLAGRNFESYGEDPVLAGLICAGYVDGCQKIGIGACPKHYALNNQEKMRGLGSSDTTESVMRNLYLKAFEIVVKKSRPWMIMNSYNRINGVYASCCGEVQQKILKDEWGFDGVVVSDWGACHDAAACANNGMDLEMGSNHFQETLLEQAKNGTVSAAQIDEIARRVLRLIARLGLLGGPTVEHQSELNTPRHRAVAREIAEKSMVLLKNDRAFLPLNPAKIHRLAVIGPNAAYQHSMGALEYCGGSGAVHPEYEISPLDGLREYAKKHNIEIIYAQGVAFDCSEVVPSAWLGHGAGLHVDYYKSEDELHNPNAVPCHTQIDTDMCLNWDPHFQVGGRPPQFWPCRKFAARWTGQLTPDDTGVFRLGLLFNNSRGKLLIDGKTCIATEVKTRNQQHFCDFKAEAGRTYELLLEMDSYWGAPEVRLMLNRSTGDLVHEETLHAAKNADAVIFFGGTNHNYDKEAIGPGDTPTADIPNYELIGPQAEMIRELASLNPNLAVVLINGAPVSVESWIDSVPALIEAWYPGMEGGRAIAGVLFGEAEPGGRLCCTFGKHLTDYACHANKSYPGSVGADGIYHTPYVEGELMGYRYFDAQHIEPRFEFGFGLSYTTFDLKVAGPGAVRDAKNNISVTLSITNTGTRRGSTVVQLYTEPLTPAPGQPIRELKAFRKIELAPAETTLIELVLTESDLQRWQEPLPDSMLLHAGFSSRDLPLTFRV